MSDERSAPRTSSGPRKKRTFQRRKVCRFCADKAVTIDYKDPRTLRYFVSERGKIIPRRISGNCSAHQRQITEAIKRARNLALLPIASPHVMS
jgi:small subunit ribosomal protein S18